MGQHNGVDGGIVHGVGGNKLQELKQHKRSRFKPILHHGPEVEELYDEAKEEILCWSGPKQPPGPPNMIQGGNKQQSITEADSLQTGCLKRKFSTIIDLEPLQTVLASDGHEEDEILSWSGPPKTPRSPIQCDKPIIVTKPVLRVPRCSIQSNNRTDLNAQGDQVQKNQGSTKFKKSEEKEEILCWSGPPKKPVTVAAHSSSKDKVLPDTVTSVCQVICLQEIHCCINQL